MEDNEVFDIVVSEGEIAPLSIVPGDDFVETALDHYREMTDVYRKLLVPEVDYGTVPGTNKPSLLKPGAEKFRIWGQLSAEISITAKIEQWDIPVTFDTFPLFSYTSECVVRDRSGNIVTTETAICHSYETKYHWRNVNPFEVPAMFKGLYEAGLLEVSAGSIEEFAFAIQKREANGPYGKPADYWDMWDKAVAAGTAVAFKRKTRKGDMMDAYRIDSTTVRILNTSIFDQVNTLLKMSQKRAFVGGIVKAVGASQFFTLDVEDFTTKIQEGEAPIQVFVPDKKAASVKLINYVAKHGVANPGEFIRDVIAASDIEKFSLDAWVEIIALIDAAIGAYDAAPK